MLMSCSYIISKCMECGCKVSETSAASVWTTSSQCLPLTYNLTEQPYIQPGSMVLELNWCFIHIWNDTTQLKWRSSSGIRNPPCSTTIAMAVGKFIIYSLCCQVAVVKPRFHLGKHLISSASFHNKSITTWTYMNFISSLWKNLWLWTVQKRRLFYFPRKVRRAICMKDLH